MNFSLLKNNEIDCLFHLEMEYRKWISWKNFPFYFFFNSKSFEKFYKYLEFFLFVHHKEFKIEFLQ